MKEEFMSFVATIAIILIFVFGVFVGWLIFHNNKVFLNDRLQKCQKAGGEYHLYKNYDNDGYHDYCTVLKDEININ